MKRAYKLQEFVAHTSNVNCLKIGRKSSRVLVTGGEDHKVNMWAIGKPNAILSLSGHTSAVESVTFDAAEFLVVAGAASGTIKLWDLEEAKVVRTLTGHRSNCIAVDFHPFGEFFASGSLDTNLKIWDIRRKGCIHTYKGHTRGVNAIKFSPDGRWVVSGGEDNIVKLWDLTAGKLMHDFKCHEGQILCLDFHPHEFLLATGSADRTVKFWDLETFELIGSGGPEATGVRSMIFNPDGRTLLAGLHESLKVFSWEPSRCHDVVDVGWSKLADLNIHEGKLLGCSFNQSCVGIWVVDLSRVGPYTAGSNNRPNGISSANQPAQQMVEGSLKSSSMLRSALTHAESSMKEVKLSTPTLSAESVPNTPQRVGSTVSTKASAPVSSAASTYMLASRRAVTTGKVQPVSIVQSLNKVDTTSLIVPRHGSGVDTAVPTITRPVLEMTSAKSIPHTMSSKDASNAGMLADGEDEHENFKWIGSGKYRRTASGGAQRDTVARGVRHFPDDAVIPHEDRFAGAREAAVMGCVEFGRVSSLASTFDRKDRAPGLDMIGLSTVHAKGIQNVLEKSATLMGNDADIIEELMQQHSSFASVMQLRLKKLQVVRRFWIKNDLKGAVEAMEKMADHAVLVDVLSCLVDRSDAFTLEVCTLLLPLLNGLLRSGLDRFLSTALAVLSVLVKNFGEIIHTTRTASPSFGVDLHAEQRIERCNTCYVELQAIIETLTPLLRKGGEIGKSAQNLSISLQEV